MAFQPSRDVSVETQLADVQKNLELFIQSLIGMTPQVLMEILEPVLEQAQIYCPWKTGALRNSGYLEVMQQGTGGQISAEIGFARGGEPSYAIIVHENLEAYHVPPTQAKFLEQAVNEVMPNIEDQIFRKYKQGVVL